MMEDIEKLTDHAIKHKILMIKSGDIEMHFHPTALMDNLITTGKAEEEEELTDEERLEKEKKQLDSDLFYSAE